MSVQTEIDRLQAAKAELKSAIEAKGVTVPEAATLDGYGALVSQIPTGGGTQTGGTIKLSTNLYDENLQYATAIFADNTAIMGTSSGGGYEYGGTLSNVLYFSFVSGKSSGIKKFPILDGECELLYSVTGSDNAIYLVYKINGPCTLYRG